MICANPGRTLADTAIDLSETVFDPVHGRFFRVEDCAQNRQGWGREVRSTDEVALCSHG